MRHRAVFAVGRPSHARLAIFNAAAIPACSARMISSESRFSLFVTLR
jgi:hypothetical protein